jgi:hypothetical protein
MVKWQAAGMASAQSKELRMEPGREEYKGHVIELRVRQAGPEPEREVGPEAEAELVIDAEPIRYGQLPDGSYFLQEYAYAWHDNLMDLARGFIDYQDRASAMRRGSQPGEEQ